MESGATYTVGVRARNAGGASAWVNSPETTPPALSVANATVAEPGGGGTASLDFVVTLSHAAAAAVSADYTAASGTLSFAAGETTKTVSISVLNDAHDEGSETLTLTLSNASGAVIKSGGGTATGTITNDDPIPQAWISRFGRMLAHQVLDAVDARMDSQPTAGLAMTLLYRPVDRFRKALDLVPDGFGGRHPDKGTGLRVVVLHEVIDFEGEWANTGEGTASNGLLGNDAEETFHLIDP